MEMPELKQFCDLTCEDFERHAVWIGCHTADYDQPWYDDTDEETFRAFSGELPVEASQGMFVVRASLELRDGSTYWGFMTPASDSEDLGIQQPHIWVGNRAFGFWGGLFGVPAEERQALYGALGKSAGEVFPLLFTVDPALARGNVSGQVDGFYQTSGSPET